MGEPVPVRVGDCRCPGRPHDERDDLAGDYVYLEPRLSATAGAAATYAMQQSKLTTADMIGALAGVFMANCILAWDFLRAVEVDGKVPKIRIDPVPIDRETIDEYLPWADGGSIVAAECDRLYAEDFLRPLGIVLPKSSRDGRTAQSTSVIPQRGPKRPRPSKQSLQNGTDGSQSAVRV